MTGTTKGESGTDFLDLKAHVPGGAWGGGCYKTGYFWLFFQEF